MPREEWYFNKIHLRKACRMTKKRKRLETGMLVKKKSNISCVPGTILGSSGREINEINKISVFPKVKLEWSWREDEEFSAMWY